MTANTGFLMERSERVMGYRLTGIEPVADFLQDVVNAEQQNPEFGVQAEDKGSKENVRKAEENHPNPREDVVVARVVLHEHRGETADDREATYSNAPKDPQPEQDLNDI